MEMEEVVQVEMGDDDGEGDDGLSKEAEMMMI